MAGVVKSGEVVVMGDEWNGHCYSMSLCLLPLIGIS